jgi:hypothetical protein
VPTELAQLMLLFVLPDSQACVYGCTGRQVALALALAPRHEQALSDCSQVMQALRKLARKHLGDDTVLYTTDPPVRDLGHAAHSVET